VTVKIADFRRFLFPLWRHLRWVWLARNAARPELLSRQIVLGRPLIFADFGGHDFPSFSERRPKRQLAGAVLGSSPRGIGSLGRVSRAGNIVIFTTSRSAGARQELRSIRGL
jgi:hypothetical protein